MGGVLRLSAIASWQEDWAGLVLGVGYAVSAEIAGIASAEKEQRRRGKRQASQLSSPLDHPPADEAGIVLTPSGMFCSSKVLP